MVAYESESSANQSGMQTRSIDSGEQRAELDLFNKHKDRKPKNKTTS